MGKIIVLLQIKKVFSCMRNGLHILTIAYAISYLCILNNMDGREGEKDSTLKGGRHEEGKKKGRRDTRGKGIRHEEEGEG